MVGLEDISSPTLVCASEIWKNKKLKSDLGDRDIQVLKNILEANDFDAIPLIDKEGKITRVARRRYHDGDPDEVFVISDEEVDELLFSDENNTILDVIFFVISSEHHVALTGPRLHRDECRIVTLHTLAENDEVRKYLSLKIAELSSDSKTLDAHLGNTIFKKICEQAKKTDSPASEVSDYEFTKNAVDLLELMQPLKSSGFTDCDKVNAPSEESWNIPLEGGIRARDFAVSPMWGIEEEEDREIEIRDSALKSLSDANDFDQLLGFRKDSSRAVGVWSKQTGVWKKEEHRRVDGNRSLDHVIERMNRGKKRKKHQAGPVIVYLGEKEGYGIITIEELMAPPVLYEMMTRMVNLENKIKSYFLEKGHKELSPTGWAGSRKKKTERLSLGNLLSSREKLGKKYFGVSTKEADLLTSFRNDLSHELFGEEGELDFHRCYSAWVTKKKILEVLDS